MLKETSFIRICGMILAAASCGSRDITGDGAVQGGADGMPAGGGKHDASPGTCTALSPPGAKLAWEDNGNSECATVVTATRMTNASEDFLEVVAGTSAGVPIGFTVVSYASALGGTYECKTDAGIATQYVDFVYPGALIDCTITIVNPGTPGSANVVGTFFAALTATGGGTTTVSNGSFDTPVAVSGG